MTRYALILSIAVLAACAAGSPSPPPPHSPSVKALTCDLSSKVKVLSPQYDPEAAQYSPPGDNIEHDFNYLRPEIQNDLKNAFDSAPQPFQDRLCSPDLAGIYITQNGCGSGGANNCQIGTTDQMLAASWGFRSWRANAPDRGTNYIAISAGLWPGNPSGPATTPALSFHEFADRELGLLASWRTISLGPHIRNAMPDYSWMTVLAALAHEYAHVLWPNTVLKNSPGGNDYDFSTLTNCAISSPAFNFYQYWNYGNTVNKLRPNGRWRKFKGRDTAGGNVDHVRLPTIAQFESNSLSVDDKSDLFFLLYQFNQPWASYFASWVPDEDFIETYKLKVLTTASTPLTQLPVTITYSDGSTQEVDIPKDYVARRKIALLAKISCVPN